MRCVQDPGVLPFAVAHDLRIVIQGRVCGAIWGGSGVAVGMKNYVGLQLAFVGVGCTLLIILWRELKAKTG